MNKRSMPVSSDLNHPYIISTLAYGHELLLVITSSQVGPVLRLFVTVTFVTLPYCVQWTVPYMCSRRLQAYDQCHPNLALLPRCYPQIVTRIVLPTSSTRQDVPPTS